MEYCNILKGVIDDAIISAISFHFVLVNYKYNEEFCKALGQQVRRIRQREGISMRKLALEAEMEYSQLSKIERGVINTTVSSLYALATAMNIPVKEFFDFKVPKK